MKPKIIMSIMVVAISITAVALFVAAGLRDLWPKCCYSCAGTTTKKGCYAACNRQCGDNSVVLRRCKELCDINK